MKRFLALAAPIGTAFSLLVHANTPDEKYVQIYNIIFEADQLAGNGQTAVARERYLQAEEALKQLQKGSPNWNSAVVQFRLNYLAEKLGGSPRPTAPAAGNIEQAKQPEKPSSKTAAQSAPDERDGQIQVLSQQVRQLEEDKRVLDAKLKEALSAQPAAIDPRELAKAEERIKQLEKEKEVLQVTIQQEQAKQPKGEPADDLHKALAEANDRLEKQNEVVTALKREKEILEAKLRSLQKEDLVKALRAENEMLKKQLANAKPSETTELVKSAKAEGVNEEAVVRALQSSVNNLQQENEQLERTKKELEAKLASVQIPVARPGAPDADHIKRLEKERDELLKKLNDTSRQLYDNKARTELLEKEDFVKQLSSLKARLEVLDATRIPYTPEELALFKQPQLTTSKPEKKAEAAPSRNLPRGAAPLIAEAERAFTAKKFADAEQKYNEALNLDEKNTVILSNLAAAQLEQGRFEDAENNLRRALSHDPTDGHVLSLLGILKFRQEKFDDALDALSRAAQVDPKNPETQNYLGITLSQKGQRAAAETALRRAIQLAPGYGGAHHNLAVVYATQKPPFTELARFHYQKALSGGHPQNPELEKLIEASNTAANAK